jgi:hypothetical protein
MIELAYAGMVICKLVSQDIDKSTDNNDRVCEYQCQDKRKNEVVYTDNQYQCPRTLYVDKLKNGN